PQRAQRPRRGNLAPRRPPPSRRRSAHAGSHRPHRAEALPAFGAGEGSPAKCHRLLASLPSTDSRASTGPEVTRDTSSRHYFFLCLVFVFAFLFLVFLCLVQPV